jgi:hypothetical protein
MNIGKNPPKCACPRRLIKMFSQYDAAYGKYFFDIGYLAAGSLKT